MAEPAIPPQEFSGRREKAIAEARARSLRGLLVCARGGGSLDRYGDVLYLTNFYTPFPYIPDLPGHWTGRAHAFLVLPVDDPPCLIADVPDDGTIALPSESISYADLVIEETIEALKRAGLDRGPVGLVGVDVLPLKAFQQISAALEDVEWCDAQDILSDLRAVKSPAEIACLRHSAQVGSRTIESMMSAAVPGATHGEIVAAGQAVLNPAGGALYNSFMASGRGGDSPLYVRSNFPTWASQEPLADGHWLRLGISGVVNGYVFDVSRSKAVGQATNRQIELFEAAISCVEAGIERARPGATAAELARAGLGRQEELGFPLVGVFSGMGHGIGLGWDAPWLAAGDETEIRPNMVLNFERTVRHDGYLGDFEETVLVTAEEPVKLTDAQLRFW
jgi:Xaa-Pro aminopeptidase